jgi:alkylhydroperoxidase/carboxymuconolactone decarboxylase family protein YurZ
MASGHAVFFGAIEVEIHETLMQVVPYAGFPAAFVAFELAQKALRGEDAATRGLMRDRALIDHNWPR